MRNIQNILEAKKRERAESGESGFSLIELIVVVVILGILAAIAIPIFLGIQDQAKNNALKGIASNAASAVAASIGDGNTQTAAAGTITDSNSKVIFKTSDATLTLAGSTLDNYCVTAAAAGSTTGASNQTSGPGC